ncbi:YqiA/YcfP family alpha/beta fold hydrolase [Gracilimonas sp.]|uniref:YqiA/YcfP family alpha/beta fold hydrolase n=1 Tax=Gracilimonas sp. TaxID=1974203 RepID=UPI0028725E8C|nr:YqiA/YcfP family alpha/beta fold hydrolase [Gracilimonas sp.]
MLRPYYGFNYKGDPNSRKIKELEKLGETITIDYDSFSTFDSIDTHLSDEIERIYLSRKDHFVVLVGTSLGGYWASVIGKKYGIPAVLINPTIQPQQSLKKHIGIEFENFKDGQLNKMPEDAPASYPDAPDVGMFLILLDLGDDVLDPKQTESWFTVNPVVIFEGGSHRFEHMTEALPEINKFINHVLTTI